MEYCERNDFAISSEQLFFAKTEIHTNLFFKKRRLTFSRGDKKK